MITIAQLKQDIKDEVAKLELEGKAEFAALKLKLNELFNHTPATGTVGTAQVVSAAPAVALVSGRPQHVEVKAPMSNIGQGIVAPIVVVEHTMPVEVAPQPVLVTPTPAPVLIPAPEPLPPEPVYLLPPEPVIIPVIPAPAPVVEAVPVPVEPPFVPVIAPVEAPVVVVPPVQVVEPTPVPVALP